MTVPRAQLSLRLLMAICLFYMCRPSSNMTEDSYLVEDCLFLPHLELEDIDYHRDMTVVSLREGTTVLM